MDQPSLNPTVPIQATQHVQPILPTQPLTTIGQEFRFLTDAELLELYRLSKSPPALTEIVRRHSPLVASVIRRLISNSQDAEDAYQATFLAMVLSVKKIRKPDSLAAWLYGVAFRSAKRVRSLRRKANQKIALQSTVGVDLDSSQSTAEEPLAIIAREFQLEAMDEELSRLPSNLREALIEHYLSGNSVPEIAQCLNLSVTAVESRLKRGRKALRMRLAMRGVSLTVVAAACLRFQQDVVATTATPWTNRFLEWVGNAGVGNPTLANLAETKTISTQLFKLVQGELVMKPFARSIVGTAGGLLVLSAIGTIGFLSALANQQSGPLPTARGGGNTVAMTLPNVFESESAETESFVLAQAGMGGLGALGGGGMGGMGSGMMGIPTSADLPKEVLIQWQKPTGPTPSWLEGRNFENERELKMRARLNDRIEFDFKDAPLSAAIDYISSTSNMPFILDQKALDDESVLHDEPITLRLNDARIKDILTLMLEPLNLTYIIEHEVVRITTMRSSANELRFYDLSYLFPNSGLTLELLAGIESTISPDQWQSQGGNSTIRTVGSMLLVCAPQETHFGVERFLYEVSKQSPANFRPRMLVEKPASKPAEEKK